VQCDVSGSTGTALLLMSTCTWNHQQEGGQAQTLIFRDARVFTGDRVLENTDVLVRDGRIAEVGSDITASAGAETIDASGRTLFPGLIDAHTHSFGDALTDALIFGVTTSLDMFTDAAMMRAFRAQQDAGGAPDRADLFSSGTLVTAPGGHGVVFHRSRRAQGRCAQCTLDTCVETHHVFPAGSLNPPRRSGSPSFDAGSCTAMPPASRARRYVSSTSSTYTWIIDGNDFHSAVASASITIESSMRTSACMIEPSGPSN
jgi:imidazolonepropionase-like amidohydrolase